MIAIATMSFKLTGSGISTRLKHQQEGLPQNTILHSIKRNLSWRIKHRMLWMPVSHQQKRFMNEKENIGHIRFKDPLEENMKNFLELEKTYGYEYYLEPINHEEKPLENEELIIQG